MPSLNAVMATADELMLGVAMASLWLGLNLLKPRLCLPQQRGLIALERQDVVSLLLLNLLSNGRLGAHGINADNASVEGQLLE
jgi:hypothetical protein